METGPGNQDELSLLSENKENISTLIPDGHWNSTKYKPSSLNKTKLVNFISFSINKFLSIKSLLEWYVPENNIPLHPSRNSTCEQMKLGIKELNMTVIIPPLLLQNNVYLIL